MSFATEKYLLVAMSNSEVKQGKKSLKKKEVAIYGHTDQIIKNAVA